jgi:hypothetical protein
VQVAHRSGESILRSAPPERGIGFAGVLAPQALLGELEASLEEVIGRF